MAEEWLAFRIETGRLVYGDRRWYAPWQHEARFTPDHLDVADRHGQIVVSLAWDESLYRADATAMSGGWGILPASRRGPSLVTARSENYQGSLVGYDQQWTLAEGSFVVHGWGQVLAALCEYLTITPRARPGLADESRLHRLLSELAAHDLKDAAYPPFGPLMGPKLDLWVATERVLRQHVHPIRGRLVEGDEPDRGALVGEVLEMLAPSVPDDWRRPEAVLPMIDKLLRSTPWPFEVLAD